MAATATSGARSIDVAHLLNELGVACKFAGRFDEAQRHYSEARALVEELLGPECEEMATLFHNFGGLAHSRQRYAEGITPATEGLALRERLNGPDHPDVAADVIALAALLEGVGDDEVAEPLYRRGLAILEATGDRHECAIARNGLGSVCQSLGRYDEAEALYLAAIEDMEAAHPDEHPALGHMLNNLATLHRRRGEDEEARALLRRAHELLVRALGEDHPVTREIAGNRARVDATPSPYV